MGFFSKLFKRKKQTVKAVAVEHTEKKEEIVEKTEPTVYNDQGETDILWPKKSAKAANNTKQKSSAASTEAKSAEKTTEGVKPEGAKKKATATASKAKKPVEKKEAKAESVASEETTVETTAEEAKEPAVEETNVATEPVAEEKNEPKAKKATKKPAAKKEVKVEEAAAPLQQATVETAAEPAEQTPVATEYAAVVVAEAPVVEESVEADEATEQTVEEVAEETVDPTADEPADLPTEDTGITVNVEAADAEAAQPSYPTFGGKRARFEIKRTKDDRYVFNLFAANQVIVATSQVYSSVQSALNGIRSIIANAPKAPIEDQTLKNWEPLSYPKWEIYLDNAKQFRFRLNATNGNCVVHSQGYTTKASCKNGIESITRNAKDAQIDKAYLKKNEDK